MQSSVWATLLRQIPADQHNNLMLVTVGGTEIALQSILRIDHEFLAIKGRLSGSQDSGRVFFLPYAHIDYLGFQKPVKDSEFNEMFAGLEVPAPAAPPAPAPQPLTPPLGVTAVAGPGLAGTGAGHDSGAFRVPAPIKSTVLERFRSRSTASGPTLRPAGEE